MDGSIVGEQRPEDLGVRPELGPRAQWTYDTMDTSGLGSRSVKDTGQIGSSNPGSIVEEEGTDLYQTYIGFTRGDRVHPRIS